MGHNLLNYNTRKHTETGSKTAVGKLVTPTGDHRAPVEGHFVPKIHMPAGNSLKDHRKIACIARSYPKYYTSRCHEAQESPNYWIFWKGNLPICGLSLRFWDLAATDHLPSKLEESWAQSPKTEKTKVQKTKKTDRRLPKGRGRAIRHRLPHWLRVSAVETWRAPLCKLYFTVTKVLYCDPQTSPNGKELIIYKNVLGRGIFVVREGLYDGSTPVAVKICPSLVFRPADRQEMEIAM